MATFTLTQSVPEMERVYIYPNGDLSGCTEWTAVGETNNYECIDEVVKDLTNYVEISSGNTTEVDQYELPNPSYSGTIKYVRINAIAKTSVSEPTDGQFYLGLSPDSNCANVDYSPNIPLTTAWREISHVWETNPDDDEDWEWSDINAMSIGIKGYSPTIAATILTEYLRPNGNYSFQLHALSGHSNNYLDVKSWGNWVYEHSTTVAGSSGYDRYTLDNETGMIPGDTVRQVTVRAYAWTDSTATLTLGIGTATGGTVFGTAQALTGTGTYYYQTWTTNPNTGAAWTESEINDMLAVVKLEVESPSNGIDSYAYCRYLVVDVEYNRTTDFAKFRVARERLEIGYEPESRSYVLNQPQTLSIDHERNVKMLNFWNGKREVYDLSRSKKTLVMKGMEFYDKDDCTDPDTRITNIRTMGRNGATVTISDLDMYCYLGDYKIRSFGWKLISNCPKVYEWILELEDTDLL